MLHGVLAIVLLAGGATTPQPVSGDGGPPLEPTNIIVTGERIDWTIPYGTVREMLNRPGTQYALIRSRVPANDGSGTCWEVQIEVPETSDLTPTSAITTEGLTDAALTLARLGIPDSAQTSGATSYDCTTTVNDTRTLDGNCPPGSACFRAIPMVCGTTTVVAPPAPVALAEPAPAAPPPAPVLPPVQATGIVIKTDTAFCCENQFASHSTHNVGLVSGPDGRFNTVIVVDHSAYPALSCHSQAHPIPIVWGGHHHHYGGFGGGHCAPR